MEKVIHLFVRSEKHYQEVHPTHAQATWYSSSDKKLYIGIFLDSRQKQIVSIIGKYAEENEIKLEIHDIADKTARKKARKMGIWRVPALMIGQHKFSKLTSDEKSLEELLDSMPNLAD